MINNSLNKNKTLIICYEDRNKFIEINQKKYGNITKNLADFLVSKESINSIVLNLQDKLNIILLELNDIEKLKQIINQKNINDILLWNISDGCDIYKGSYVPSFAKLLNIKFYGSETYAQYIAQDKFKFITLCQKLKIPTPKTILYSYKMNIFIPEIYSKIFKNNEVLFVKPNNLDNKIGIQQNSKIYLTDLKKYIEEDINSFKNDLLIQNYIEGYDVRVCYIGGDPLDEEKIGILKVQSFLSDENNSVEFMCEKKRDKIKRNVYKLEDNNLIKNIKKDVSKICKFLNIKDYFAFDIRITNDNKNYYFIELNTAPFVINELMEGYAKLYHNETIQEVFYDSIITSFNK